MPGFNRGGSLRAIPGRVSRRNLIRTGTAGVATYALASTAGVIDPGHLLGQEASAEPALREFVFTASEFDWELMAGTTVRVWGYNGQMPGPEMRVTRGRYGPGHPASTSCRCRPPSTGTASMCRPPMDGVAGLNQAPVEPGEAFTYEFTANPAGTRWYHSHTDPARAGAAGPATAP